MNLRRCFPPQTDLPPRRLLLAAVFAFLGIAAATVVTLATLQGPAAPFLVASMGAAAVLLYIVPTSPMSTPWAFIGGHLSSATLAITLQQTLPSSALAAPLAVGGAIVLMYLLRCLHPPGGAVALLTIVGGEPVRELGYGFLITPLGLNLGAMLVLYLGYRRLLHHLEERARLLEPRLDTADRTGTLPFEEGDLERALADMGSFVDITHRDLKRIYLRARTHALLRQVGNRRSVELAAPPVSVEYATPLSEVWRLFQDHAHLPALPVTDRVGHVLGLITRERFLREAEHWGEGDLRRGIQRLCRPSGRLECEHPEAAGQIMDKPIPLIPADTPALQALETLHDSPHPLLPVIDARKRLIGLLLPPQAPVDSEKSGQ